MITVEKYMEAGKNAFEAICLAYGAESPRMISHVQPLAAAYAKLREWVINNHPSIMRGRYTQHNPVLAWSEKASKAEQERAIKELAL